ncbi:MAG: MMPL family transporter [Candidatus Binatia bacterium]
MRRLLTVPLRAPRLTLAVVVAVTVFFGFFARSMQFDSSVENLLPANDPDKLYYDGVKKEFGDEAITVIGVFAADVFAPATLAKISRLSKRLANIEGVREVISLTTVQGIEMTDFGLNTGRLMVKLPRTPEEAAAFRAKVLGNPLYVKNIVSADGRAAGISVVFEDMSDEELLQRRIEDQIRAAVAASGGPEQFAITGIPTIKVFSARFMQGDTAKFLPFGILIAIGVLIWAFRTARGVLLPLSTVLAGVVWTTGLMELTGTPINMGTLVLPALLMAVGIAYAIHIMAQYYRELRPGRPTADVVAATLQHISVPLTIAALTTLIGFATFMVTPIPAIREFGVFSVFGISVIFLLSLSVPPAALMLLPSPKRVSRLNAETGRLPRLLRTLGEAAVRHNRSILIAGVLLCGLSLWGVTRIRVETDFLGFFSPQSEIRTDNALVAERLAGTQPVYVVIDGGKPETATRLETLTLMAQLQAFIEQQPGVDKTMSLLDYLGLLRHVLTPDAGRLPQTQSEVDQLLLLINPSDVQAVVNRDHSRANIIVRTRLSGSQEVGDFVSRIKAFAAEHFPRGLTVRPTGTVVLLNRSADTLAWGQVTSLWQVFVVLAILMSILFLSVRVGLLSLIPNLFPIIILFGVMGWSGISLNISTSLIAALAIGIAIDDTIHYLSTFNAQLRETGNQAQAVRNATCAMGKPMIVTSVALCLGFLVVCLSNFQPVKYFGYLSSVTMAVALVSDLFITPSVVMTTKIITLWDLLFLKLGPAPHKQIPLFAGLRPFQSKLVVLMGRLETARRGTFITRRGELKPELYVLLNGRADVSRGDGTRPIRTLGRGDVVGEMGLVRQRPRSADVVAAADLEYMALDGRFLQRLRRRYPRIAATVFLNLTRILSDRLESTTDALAAEREETGPVAQHGAGAKAQG